MDKSETQKFSGQGANDPAGSAPEPDTGGSPKPRRGHLVRWWVVLILTVCAFGLWWWGTFSVSGKVTSEAVGLAWHLARGGALELSASDVPIDGKASSIELATQSDGATWIEIKHPQAGAKLALGENASWGRLLLGRSRLALIMDPGLPDFSLGDPAVDSLPLPDFEVPRLKARQVLLLPLLLRSQKVTSGADGSLEWQSAKQSARAHFAEGQLSQVEILGVLPASRPLVIRLTRLPAGALRERFASLEPLPEGTRAEPVPRGIFLRSIDGLLTALQP